MKKLSVIDPYLLKKIKDVSFSSERSIEKSIQNAHKVFPEYSLSSTYDRIQWLKIAFSKLTDLKAECAKTISQETGKPITLAHAEVHRALNVIEFGIAELYSPHTGELLSTDLQSNKNTGFGIHKRFSKGIILGVCPFNFPLNLALHKIIPSIVTGSPILIKPSLFTPLTALKLKSHIFNHLPSGAFDVIIPQDSQMKRISQDSRIAHISFTGSDQIGFKILKESPLKSHTLELGGNAWCIVSENANEKDLPHIAEKIINASFSFAGQSCISIQNIAIHRKYFSKLKKLLIEKAESFPLGDPLDPLTLCGPMIHKKAALKAQQILKRKLSGKIIFQKHPKEKHPHFFPLTLCEFPEIDKNSKLKNDPLIQNEVFAPIANIHSYSKLENTIQAIQNSPYGLQCGIFTSQIKEAYLLYEKLETGGVQMNNVPSLRYDHQPYGGEKKSGRGREGIVYSIMEYTYSKFLGIHF